MMIRKLKTISILAASLFAATPSLALTLNTPFGPQEVPDNPQRIVVFDMASADNLDFYGESHRVVGIASGVKYPDFVYATYTKQGTQGIGTANNTDFEAISKLKPDLIIAPMRAAKQFERLSQIAPVYKVDVNPAKPYESIKLNAENMGILLGKQGLAKEYLKSLDAKLATIQKYAQGKNSLAVISYDRKLTAYGTSSVFNIIYKSFGFKPATQVESNNSFAGKDINFEYLQEVNPDVLFVIDRKRALTPIKDEAIKNFNDNLLINNTTFKKNKDIIFVNPEYWYLAYGGLKGTNLMFDEVIKHFADKK